MPRKPTVTLRDHLRASDADETTYRRMQAEFARRRAANRKEK